MVHQLYEQSTTWKSLTSLPDGQRYYNHSQQSRALLCLVAEPQATGFSFVDTIKLQHGQNGVASAVIPRVGDILEDIHHISKPYEAWIEIGQLKTAKISPGFGIRIELDEQLLSLPLVALQEDVVLFVKSYQLQEHAHSWPCPTIRYACLRDEKRRKMVKNPQKYRGFIVANGRLQIQAEPESRG